MQKIQIFTNKTVQQLYGESVQKITSTTGGYSLENSNSEGDGESIFFLKLIFIIFSIES